MTTIVYYGIFNGEAKNCLFIKFIDSVVTDTNSNTFVVLDYNLYYCFRLDVEYSTFVLCGEHWTHIAVSYRSARRQRSYGNFIKECCTVVEYVKR